MLPADIRLGDTDAAPVIERRHRRLLVNGRPAAIGSRAFDLLLTLVEQHERVVGKRELLQAVWPGLVVEENNLQVQVMSLRRVLGAQAISTVPGRGYRYTGPIESAAGEGHAAAGAAPDALIGRDELLARLGALLREPQGPRLLTLTGPGGCGKTRLALALAARAAMAFEHGTAFVALASVADEGGILDAIAAALGLQEAGAENIEQLVPAYLRRRSALLVLDNLEHLGGAARLVAPLLDACPAMRLLCTSRSVLGLPGERVEEVPALPLPQADSAAARRASAAVMLLALRARGAGRPLADDDRTLRAAADICRRLDGLPLAIELAASRLRVLTPQALAERLDPALPLLRAQADTTAPARQRTLHATIAWSEALLGDDAKALLARLAVCRGGFTLEAAEALDATSVQATLDSLEQLLDHALIRRAGDVHGEPRFTMLETIREFGLQRLAQRGELALMRQRHATHHLRRAQSAEPDLTSPRREAWLARLRSDIDNLRLALTWFVRERCEGAAALDLASALTWLFYFDGLYHEGRRWLAEAMALPQAHAHTRGMAAALSGAARLAGFAGDMATALQQARDSADRWQALQDPRGLGFALLHQGIPCALREGPAAAAAVLRRGEAAFQAACDAWGAALCKVYEGVALAHFAGHEDEALSPLEEGHARCLALGDAWAASTSRGYLGLIALRRGDLRLAREHIEHILQLARSTGDRFRIGRSAHMLAEVELAQDRPAAALRLLAEALTLMREQGRHGDLPQTLTALVRPFVALGAHASAAWLIGAGSAREGLPKSTLPPQPPAAMQGDHEDCRAALGDEALAERVRQGRATPLQQAVDVALAEAGVLLAAKGSAPLAAMVSAGPAALPLRHTTAVVSPSTRRTPAPPS